jgi:hypothetical protein
MHGKKFGIGWPRALKEFCPLNYPTIDIFANWIRSLSPSRNKKGKGAPKSFSSSAFVALVSHISPVEWLIALSTISA